VRDVPEQVPALQQTTAAISGEAGELEETLLRLRFWTLYHLNELGDSAVQAITAGESLVHDWERLLGPDHPNVLNCRNSLAIAYQAAGRAAEAIPLYEQNLADRARGLSRQCPVTCR
jgi:hypothetical protein